MKGRLAVALMISGVFLSLAALYGRIMIDGDGLSYYALTLSLVHDHDFDLRNQKEHLQGVMAPLNQETGKPASLFSCGFAVLYAPLLLALEHVPVLAQQRLYPQNAWIPFAHSLAIFAQSLLFGMGAMLLAYTFSVRRLAVSPAAAGILCVSAALGTPMFFYAVTMPSYSHAADVFLTTCVFVLVLSDWKSAWRCLLAGLLLALSVMLRNNNAVFWPVALAALLYAERPRWLRAGGWMLAGALPVVIAHALFNQSQYGKLLATGYRVQTETGFLIEMLFHPYAGVFVWAPITALAAIGLLVGVFRKNREAIVSMAAVALVLLSVQFQGNWWGGCSFGQRFFTHLFLFWIVGLSQLAAWRPKPVTMLAILCAMWTFFLFNVYLVNAGSVEGRKALNANNCRRTPVELIAAARANYLQSGAPGAFSYWTACLSARPYPTLFFVFTAR